jgi:hypothetical protein
VRAAWIRTGRSRTGSSTVTSCTTPGAVQTARDGGTIQLLPAAFRRITPSRAYVSWPNGCVCGATLSAASRSRAVSVTGRAGVGSKQSGKGKV